MNTYTFSYGSIIILENNIAEVIISDGIEINDNIVTDFHDFLRSKFEGSFFLLINKKYAYTYNFDAQKRIGTIDEIKAIAVISSSSSGELSTRILKQVNQKDLNLKLFLTRIEALDWLHKQ